MEPVEIPRLSKLDDKWLIYWQLGTEWYAAPCDEAAEAYRKAEIEFESNMEVDDE